MRPAEAFTPEQLVGKRVTFKTDEDHVACWHYKVGLKTAVVIKLGQSLAQKAQLLGTEGEIPPELLAPEYDVPRLWVRVDPGGLFPRGCEVAVEQACLLVLDPPA